jgi:acetyl-CoA carboxylase carboxyl transferase subunit beta
MAMSEEFRICGKCKAEIANSVLEKNGSICPECGNYLSLDAFKRIEMIADEDSFKRWSNDENFSNPLNDELYEQVFNKARNKHSLNDAIIDGEITIGGVRTAIGVMDTRFMMASMGHIVGERVTRIFETATRKKLPVILFCCSGGARMQEGMIALMQMEKTAAAVKRHSDAGLLYISVLTNPTMGGVTASFATLADVILAEKGAMIGFAGARVIEQNTGKKLPSGFQTAQFQRDHGFVDMVVDRYDMKETLNRIIKLHQKPHKIYYMVQGRIITEDDIRVKKYVERTPWERVQIARSINRPTSMDYINNLFSEFIELSGDRAGSDDHAVIGGLASINGFPVTVIGHQKGKESMEDATYRNWGMPSPQGYRKAMRLAKQAEKFKRPIIFFIDTIGAACGQEAEEDGQGTAIAELLMEMSTLKTPTLSIVIGEGGSGGALALGIANEVWMLENSVYSVITPESYASILWKDNSKFEQAANQMKLEARDLFNLKVIDKIIYEDEPVTKSNMATICAELKYEIMGFLNKYRKKNVNTVVKERYQKFRQY